MGKTTIHRVTATLSIAIILAMLWYGLAGTEGWGFAVIAISAIALLSHRMRSPSPYRLSPLGLLDFARFFVLRSLHGGIDVSCRALAPSLPIHTQLQDHQFSIPAGPGRTVFIASLSLMPGTLSVSLKGDTLLVHSIAGSVDEDLKELEAMSARLFRKIKRNGDPND